MADNLTVYIDDLHSSTIDTLKNEGDGLFSLFIEPVVLAAIIGFSEGRKVTTSGKRREFPGSVFENNGFASYIYLMAVADADDPAVLKDGNEREWASVFSSYANGGYEIISEWQEANGGALIECLLDKMERKAMTILEKEGEEPPSIGPI